MGKVLTINSDKNWKRKTNKKLIITLANQNCFSLFCKNLVNSVQFCPHFWLLRKFAFVYNDHLTKKFYDQSNLNYKFYQKIFECRWKCHIALFEDACLKKDFLWLTSLNLLFISIKIKLNVNLICVYILL